MAGSEEQRVETLLYLYESGLIKSQKELHRSHIQRLIKDFDCLDIYDDSGLCGAIFYFYPDEDTVVLVEVFVFSENTRLYLSKISGIVRNRKKVLFKVKSSNIRMIRFCEKIKCSMQYAENGWVYCMIERG